MSISICPAAVVAAPVESVWELITEPALRDEWWDASTERVVPEGKAVPGQVIYLKFPPLFRRWEPMLTVLMVDAEKHQIRWDLTTPLGIVNHQTTSCKAIDAGSCRVQYG